LKNRQEPTHHVSFRAAEISTQAEGGREEAIPRHNEINEKLAQAILRRAKGGK
jgi:hypothetical protein